MLQLSSQLVWVLGYGWLDLLLVGLLRRVCLDTVWPSTSMAKNDKQPVRNFAFHIGINDLNVHYYENNLS